MAASSQHAVAMPLHHANRTQEPFPRALHIFGCRRYGGTDGYLHDEATVTGICHGGHSAVASVTGRTLQTPPVARATAFATRARGTVPTYEQQFVLTDTRNAHDGLGSLLPTA